MKLLFDLLPLIVFFATFKFYDIYAATIAAIVMTFIQVGVFWCKYRRFEITHLVMLATISLFGGMTVMLQDDTFIKWKPTIINWVFAGVILGGMLLRKKTALEYVMGKQITLPVPVWRKLNIAWMLFFLFVGGVNLYVAFFYNRAAEEAIRTGTWVNFKVFGLTGLTLVFVVLQFVFLAKYITDTSVNKPRN